MNLPPSRWTELLSRAMERSGACRWGIAAAGEVEAMARAHYDAWLASGYAAAMDYMHRYGEVRSDTRLLLEGARSMVVAAFPYLPPRLLPDRGPQFARYAYGSDYHDVIRTRLQEVAGTLTAEGGARYRVCVDTAPLRERYWAQRCGVGFIGRNNQLIVPGHGSWVLLGCMLTTLELPETAPLADGCPDGCRKCIDRCPGAAISPHGSVDARRCLSYLTIEHRGPFPTGTHVGKHVYGCDECQLACPFNEGVGPTAIEEFHPTEAFLSITRQSLEALDAEGFAALFKGSAVKRTKLAGLRRNLGVGS